MTTYKITRNDKGHLVVQNVPIFVECTRDKHSFDADWMVAAAKNAHQAAQDNYFPPLHIRHHDCLDGPWPEAAGFFRITRTGPLTYKGTTRTALFADLIITREWVERDVLELRLPYRSVEIFDFKKPAIDSLALLDHEPPYLELPLLVIDEPDPAQCPDTAIPSATPGTLVPIASATFANPWRAEGYRRDEPLVACFRRGHSARFFLQDDPDSEDPTMPGITKPKADTKSVAMKDDPKPKDGDDPKPKDGEGEGGSMAGDSIDVSAVAKAIKDGSISVAAMEELEAAIIERKSAVGTDEPGDAPAPVATPGAAMAKKDPELVQEFAKLSGENLALKARLDERDATDKRKDDVANAMGRLKGRPLGSTLEADLVAFHKEHGPDAFKTHVDTIAATFGAIEGRDPQTDGDDTPPGAPDEAMAYTEHGVKAVEDATRFSAEWDQLHKHGATQMSRERYIQINMESKGVKLKK